MCCNCSLEQENMLTLGGDSSSDLFQFLVQKPPGDLEVWFLIERRLIGLVLASLKEE